MPNNPPPKPAPRRNAAAARYSAQASLYANPTGPEGHRVIPVRESDPPEFLGCGDPRCGCGSPAMRQPTPEIGTTLHEWAEGFRFGRDVVSDPGPEIGTPRVSGTEPHSWAENAFDRPSDPPCLDDAEPLAVDAVMPAVVDVLNAITARLEQLRDGGHPARRDGVTEGEQAAWRAGLNRAIGITSSSALIASGVGRGRAR